MLACICSGSYIIETALCFPPFKQVKFGYIPGSKGNTTWRCGSVQRWTGKCDVPSFCFSSNCSSRVPWLKSGSVKPECFGRVCCDSNSIQEARYFSLSAAQSQISFFLKTTKLDFLGTEAAHSNSRPQVLVASVLTQKYFWETHVSCSSPPALSNIYRCRYNFAKTSIKPKKAAKCLFLPWLK